MPRTASPDTRTASQRARDSQARRATRTLHLPGDVLADAEAVRARDGDASLVACVTRLIREAAAS